MLVFVFWCDKTGSYTESSWLLSRVPLFALGMSRARILQICHCRDCANVYEIFASLNVFTFERSLGSGPSTESHHSRRHSLSLSLCDRRCCVEMHERSDFSSLATCVDMKCSTTRPTTSSYMFSGGKKISFGLLKHETRSANRFASEKGVKNGKVA